MTTHELTIRKPYLDLVASGVKTVEVRVGYPKIRGIRAGDELVLVCGGERLATRVTRVSVYASFEEMLGHEDPVAIGGELGRDREELLAVIRGIYPPAKERLGVHAIGVRPLEG